MESEKDKPTGNEGGMFRCVKCGLEEQYLYKGKQPPFAKKIVFLETCYATRDPFSPPDKHQFLVLGSDCDLCKGMVCQSSECSIFYTKRFCKTCAEQNLQLFPTAVQNKLKKPK